MVNIKFLKNKYSLLFFIYIAVLVFFVVFSYKILFHDTWEYIALAKKFAGYLNSSAFSVHSLIYPFFLSFFIKYFPSMLTLKLVNTSWIILIGFLLYKSDLKQTAFLIWVFSPVTWMIAPIISPIIPASFFLLLAYLSIKKWQESKKNFYFIISALALGLSAALHFLLMIFAIFFILAFFYNKKFKQVIFFTLFTFLSFSTRLILDACLFTLSIQDKLIPFPFYSLIRIWGVTILIQLGLYSETPMSHLSFSSFNYLYFLFIISPLLFYLYKINIQKNKQAIIFLILSTLFLLIKGGGYFYYILLAPIAIILLSETFKRKELCLHILISFFIILILVCPYLIKDKQEIENRNIIINDLKTINKDFSFDAAIFDETRTLAMFYVWDKNLPYFVSVGEYNQILQGGYRSQYNFEVKPKIDTSITLEFKAGLKPNIKKDIDYENLPWLLEKGETPPEGYKLTKCYNLLCLYQK